MPYCPKCDTEFVDGITVCSDCGGPLAASKEAYLREQSQQEPAHQPQDMSYEDLADMPKEPVPDLFHTSGAIYVKKSQHYEDLKSSASAFFLVGGAMTLFAVLCWTDILHIPLATASKLLFQTVLTLMGAALLVIAFATARSAKKEAAQVGEEEAMTKELVDWFASTYSRDGLDEQLHMEYPDITEDEMNLKRFELIQDYLVTNRDLPDQAYVDALCEEIYSRLYD